MSRFGSAPRLNPKLTAMFTLKPSAVVTFIAIAASATAAHAGVPGPAGLQQSIQQANQLASPADLRPLGITIGRPSAAMATPTVPTLQPPQSTLRPQAPQQQRPSSGIAQ